MFLQNTNAPVERIPTSPPIILPVPAHITRPVWSVMIPVYNCIEYLQETLESVLAQGIGSEQMQISVIDDCSTDGDVEALVLAIGGTRVEYYRQEKNVGSLRNFETCVKRSIGEWIHILHGDDKVLFGFYAEIETLFREYPVAGASFTNFAHIVGPDKSLHTNEPLSSKRTILENFLMQNAEWIQVQPPAIVVKRAVYEKIGTFYAAHYGEDWEMWTRIAAHFPIAYSPACLAQYRYYINNGITQKSIANGQNIKDIIKIISIIQTYLPANEKLQIKKRTEKKYAFYCLSLADSLYPINRQSSLIQAKGAVKLSNDPKVYYAFVRFIVKQAIHYEQIKDVLRKAMIRFSK